MEGKVCDDLGEKTFSLYVQNFELILNGSVDLQYSGERRR